MTTLSTILILFLAALIGFNIWNTINLGSLLKRPQRNDQLNDKNYWELKYKMQYMITIFSVVVAIAAYLGYSTIDDVKDSVRKEFQSRLDSAKTNMDAINKQLANSQVLIDSKIKNVDSVLNHYQDMLQGFAERSQGVQKTIAISTSELNAFKKRIDDINAKNIIQQNIFIANNVIFNEKDIERGDVKKVLFSNLITISGDKLPTFTKPPFILAISNEGGVFLIQHVNTSSFDLQLMSSPGDAKSITATLFITQNP